MKQKEQSMVDLTELERLQENALATNGTVNEGPEWAAFTHALGMVFPTILKERQAMLAKLEAAAIPPGYKLVPVEPTEAMIEAGMDAPRKDSDTFLCVWREDVAKVYKAMIAAIEGEQ